MRVAVTGGTGYLGAHVVRGLLAAGHSVSLLAESGWENPSLLRRLSEQGSVTVHRGDVRDSTQMAAFMAESEAVVNAAGVVGTDDRREKLMWEINAHAAEAIMQRAHEFGLDPIVLVSSYSALFPPTGPIITPDSPTAQGKSAYARTKSYADRAARRLQEAGAPVVVTYPSSVVGPAFETPPGVTEQGWAAIVKGRVAPLVRDAGMMMIDVRDVADVHSALMRPEQGPKRYLCGGVMLSFDEMISSIEAGSGRHVRRIPMSPKAFRALGRIADLAAGFVPISSGFSYEAAQLITAAIPTDDRQTLSELGLTWRSPREAIIATFG